METLVTFDYRAIVEQSPSLYLLLKPDAPSYSIISVIEAYLNVTMTKREEIAGKKMFELFPDNPSDHRPTGMQNLRASLDRAVKNRAADTMTVQKYDIRPFARDITELLQTRETLRNCK
jgi:hypothetical protein